MSLLQDMMNRLKGQPKRQRDPLRVMVLDDDKERHVWFARRFAGDNLDVAYDVATARELLKNGSYDVIFLDHDLLPEHYNATEWDDESTGYAIAAAMVQNPRPHLSATIIVHTLNPDGARRMVEALHNAGFTVEYIPFPLLEHRLRKYWQ